MFTNDQVFNDGRDDDGENWLVSTDYDQECARWRWFEQWKPSFNIEDGLNNEKLYFFYQGRHGIESPNLKNEYRTGEGGEEAKPCVEDDCGNQYDDEHSAT